MDEDADEGEPVMIVMIVVTTIELGLLLAEDEEGEEAAEDEVTGCPELDWCAEDDDVDGCA